MIVSFRRPWWSGENLYPKSPDGIEVPDRFRDKLPSTAVILSVEEATTKQTKRKVREAKKAEAEPDTFSALGKLMSDSTLEV